MVGGSMLRVRGKGRTRRGHCSADLALAISAAVADLTCVATKLRGVGYGMGYAGTTGRKGG
jgi:hypothetical protein